MYNITKNKLLIIGILCVLLMCISGIYAFSFMTAVNVEDNINTGIVDIELSEYMINNDSGNRENYYDSENTFFPSSKISLIPQIQNKGASCYIRFKVTYSIDSTLINVPQYCMEGLNSDFQQFGDYWYYKNPLQSGNNLDIFHAFIVPNELSNNAQNKYLTLNIVAEAVQSKNFTPDYNSKDPWNNLQVNQTIKYQTDKVQKSSNVKIEYENSANQFVNIPDDFFEGLNDMMPGDSITQSINIMAGKQNTKFYFRIVEPQNVSNREIELLKKLNLKIVCDNSVIFNNSLYQLENQLLGTYTSGEQKELKFTITMPKELGNEYAMLSSTLNWKFSIEDDRTVPKPPPDTPEQEPEKEPEQPKEPEQKPKPVQTGDVKIKIALAVFIVAAIGLIVVFALEKKHKQHEKNNINKN